LMYNVIQDRLPPSDFHELYRHMKMHKLGSLSTLVSSFRLRSFTISDLFRFPRAKMAPRPADATDLEGEREIKAKVSLAVPCRPAFPSSIDPGGTTKAPKCRRTKARAAIRYLLGCPVCNHLVAGKAQPIDTSQLCPDCSHAFCKGKGAGKCCKFYKAFKNEARKCQAYPFPSRMSARDRRSAFFAFDPYIDADADADAYADADADETREPDPERGASSEISPVLPTLLLTPSSPTYSVYDRFFYDFFLDTPLSPEPSEDIWESGS